MKRQLAILVALTAMAADWQQLKPQGHVSDFAGVIDPASRRQLERYCAAVKESTGAEIALVTLPTLDGEPVEDVANTLFRQWGVGSKQTNEGIMLLLAVGERRSRLEVGYGLEPIIPDGFAGSVLREMRPALRDQHYGDAMIQAARVIGERIAEAKRVGVSEQAPAPQRQRQPESLPWGMLIGAAVVLLFLLGVGGRFGYRRGLDGYMLALLLGHLSGRRRWGHRGGGWSGGGFGGYDSSDRFGGFGGGDAGGGGASSDW
ncbi:MAG: TPM domain-containing protein [Acidimicrobiia bacterium]|nr:TPM domain-containing protein [Acidimicrobiia bacterium]